MARLRGLGTALCLAAALWGAPGAAQPVPAAQPAQPQQPQQPPIVADEGPAPIPLADVPAEAERVATFLRDAQEAVRATPDQGALTRGFGDARATIAKRGARTADLVSDPPGLSAIDDEERYWRRVLDQVKRWRVTLTNELVELDDTLRQLRRAAEVWDLTQEEARAERAPPAVLQRIDGVVADLGSAVELAQAQRATLLELQAQISEVEGQISDAVQSLAVARDSVRTAMLRRDSPALWRVRALWRSAGRAPQEIGRSAGARGANLVEYVDDHGDSMLVLGVLFCFLAAVGLRGRRKLARDDDPQLHAFAVIFERPWSSALLLTVLVGPLVHAHAPRAFDEVLGLLLLIPLMRLLPGLVRPAWRPSVYLLAAFMAFDTLRGTLVQDPIATRLVLLLETTLLTAALVWLVASAPRRRAGGELPWAQLLTLIARLAVLLMGGASLANVLGYTNLALLLAEGTLGAGFLAAIVYGAVRILQGGIYAALHNRTARQLRVLGRHESTLARWTNRVIGFAAALVWFNFALLGFHVQRPVLDTLSAVLVEDLSVGALSISLGDVVAFVVTLAAAIVLARVVRAVLEEDVLSRVQTGRGVGPAVAAVVQYSLVLLGFVAAVSAAGMHLDNLALLASAFGVGIGFGLQDVVRNFISGLILLFERPIQVGDSIAVGPVEGRVTRIGIRSSTVRTWPGSEVIVPNGQLITREVSNWTLTDRERRVDLQFFVAPDADPDAVLELLGAVAADHPSVLAEPPPVALFVGFAPESMNFELRAWVRFENFLTARSELGVAAHRVLRGAGVRLSSPQRDVRVVGEPG